MVEEGIDDDNESGKRPKTIMITLLANGKYYDEYEFNADENWFHVFENLPVYFDGEEIEYSVIEEDVPEDYVVSYEGNAKDGFIVHNGRGQGDTLPPEYENPQTGDNIILYLITLFISIIGCITGKRYIKKYED